MFLTWLIRVDHEWGMGHLSFKGRAAQPVFWFWQRLALYCKQFIWLAGKQSSCIENSFSCPHSSIPSLQHMQLQSAKRGPDWLSSAAPSVAHELFYSLKFPKRIVHIFRRTDVVAEYLNHYDFVSRNCDWFFDYKKKERSAITF